jgi:FMN phosphatase YigB (HAD superfamily)
MIRAVVFDVGETLVDETGVWAQLADWLGVPRHTFSAVHGAMIARGRPHWECLELFRPGLDMRTVDARLAAEGKEIGFGPRDLYPDARSCIEALRARGLWVGIAGNQPVRAEKDLRACELPVEMIGVSAVWGVRKPDAAFFERVLAELPDGYEPGEVLYVGDRLDNDVLPARAAGMKAAWIRRGAWAWIVDEEGDRVGGADVRLEGLDELPGWVERFNSA